jgi:hypothetical protein
MEVSLRLAPLSARLCRLFAGPRRGDGVPYPFINVGELGYDKMFLNMGVLVLVFFGLGLALVGIDRRMGRNNATAKA